MNCVGTFIRKGREEPVKPLEATLLRRERIRGQVLEKESRQRTSKHWQRIKRELTSPYCEQNDVTERKCGTLWEFAGADTR